MSNILDPDQARHFVGPDVGPNCLLRLSADNTSKQRFNSIALRMVKTLIIYMIALLTFE